MLFDFNGTLSDDEPVLYSIYAELFAEHGRPLPLRAYIAQLAGRSEEAIIAGWLGPDYPARDAVAKERIARYRERVADGGSVHRPVREAVRYAAARVPVGVVSGAARSEIEPVVRAAGLDAAISFIVAADDVAKGKPDPEGYLRALELLGGVVRAEQVLVVEDTEAGVVAAKAAGMHVLGLTGTLAADRLRQADALIERIEPELVRRLLPADAD